MAVPCGFHLVEGSLSLLCHRDVRDVEECSSEAVVTRHGHHPARKFRIWKLQSSVDVPFVI
jgi:hypothetical protein